jgi:hypothetical protein
MAHLVTRIAPAAEDTAGRRCSRHLQTERRPRSSAGRGAKPSAAHRPPTPSASARSRRHAAPEARQRRSGGCGGERLVATTGTDIDPAAPRSCPTRISYCWSSDKLLVSCRRRVRCRSPHRPASATVELIARRSGRRASRRNPSRRCCRCCRWRRCRPPHGDALAFKHVCEARSLGGVLFGRDGGCDELVSSLIRMRAGDYDRRRRSIGAGWRRCPCRWTRW